MSSNPEPVRFPYELDRFDPMNKSTIDEIDPKWAELSRQLFGETDATRDELLQLLRKKERIL
jgi:hypothetical protein